MVRKRTAYSILFILSAVPALAESPDEMMFPGMTSCYTRSYTSDHLAQHPEQRVTEITVTPDFSSTDPLLTLDVVVQLRGKPGGRFRAWAYCENQGADTLSCAMEGDAGTFTLAPSEGVAVLLTVGKDGLELENENGFVTLDSSAGDDRSFLLPPGGCG
jgi:hypothetical protein